jgi:putative oxidoreductase
MLWLNDDAPLLLRICLVVLFPFSALDKIVNWGAAMKQAGSIPFKPAMLMASIVVEVAAPLCIVIGWHDRLAAFILAGFCVVTALLFHQFWRCSDFWRFREGEGLEHFWEFLKNLGLVGGLGLVMLAPRTFPQPVTRSAAEAARIGRPGGDPAVNSATIRAPLPCRAAGVAACPPRCAPE